MHKAPNDKELKAFVDAMISLCLDHNIFIWYGVDDAFHASKINDPADLHELSLTDAEGA